MAEYIYDASGVKRTTRHLTSRSVLNLGWFTKRELAANEILDTIRTDYYDNKAYQNGTIKMILTDEGYVAWQNNAFKHYYYLKDHLGNNRVVMDAAGTIAQKNYYYPFGMTTWESVSQPAQPYKFNGKELDRMYGLDWFDYSARLYDGALGRFWSPDPMCEKYYAISPYAYCGNNPIRFTDPDGKDWLDKVAGGVIGVATNIVPFSTGARNWYSPTDADDYNSTLKGIDNAAMAVGGVMVDGGEMAAGAGVAMAATGVAASVASGGTLAVAGVPVAVAGGQLVVAGVKVAAAGSVLAANGANNASKGYNYGDKSEKSNTSSGNKNSPHANQKAKESASQKYQEAKSQYENLKSKPNKTKEESKQVESMKRQVDHLKRKADETGETHSRNAKGNR